LRDSYNIINFSAKLYSKTKILHMFTLKKGTKSEDEKLLGLKVE